LIATEAAKDFAFESILFESDRITGTVDLAPSVTDLDIYEHMGKPYLTAVLALEDSRKFISGADVLGAEKITVNIKSIRKNAVTITKTFYIDSIKIDQNVNDNNRFVVLHLIEDIGYISSLYNVNRPYSNTCTQIVKKLAKNYLGKEVYSTETDKQSMKVIVPNLSPLGAMSWITQRATTNNGYPFYLYSTLVGNKLIFADLGSLLEQPVMNADVPYRYFSGASRGKSHDVQRRTIRGYDQKNTDELLMLIRRGFIGADYQYIDTLKNQKNKFHFDIEKDFIKPAINSDLFKDTQPNPMYSSDYKHNEQSFNKYSSRMITRVGGSSAFDNRNSYLESNSKAEYKLNVISDAVFGLLKKAPIQVDVHGIDFIDGDVASATGNNIRLEFPVSSPERKEESQIDPKKSGDYLIFATQYVFKSEGCNVRLSCLKLGNQRL
jgi:hypothetical protein